MSTSSAESDPESSTSSYGNSGTPWGWLVWNIPQRTVGIPLGSTEGEHMATIGRGDYCTVTVSPTLVANSLFQRISRQHCTLEKSMEDGKFTISNHSPNGTFVNGERVDYLRTLSIDHGDVVALCSAESAANFTFYDNYHRFPGYHLHFNNKYLVLSIITSGLFGEVCRAIVKSNSSVVAIKTVHANKCEKLYDCVTVNPRGVDALRNEIAVLSQLDHPCIVKMLDSAGNWPESRMLIVMEFPGGGDLQQRMSDFSLLSEPNAKYWFVQMVSAIRYCHNRSPPIVHRNLNPSNVLLTSADEFAIVKIADFGLSKRQLCPSTLKTYCGTSLYIAPEVRRQMDDDDVEPYTAAADVWSLGVILHYMLLGRHPSCSRADYTGRSTSTQRGSVLDGPGIASVSDEARTLIDNMVAIDVGRRHDIETVARCPWLLDEDTMANLRSIVFKGAPIF